jgi:hypothetical protein
VEIIGLKWRDKDVPDPLIKVIDGLAELNCR